MRSVATGRARAPTRCRAACTALAIAWGVAGGAFAATAKSPAQAAEYSAPEIVAKNVAARGGLEAWRKIETMVWTGHLESARTPAPSLPFELEQKRPNKTRFEIHAMNQRTMRIFDGARGWKSRPSPGGRVDLVPYTPEEARYARDEPAIDGPLIDLETRGSKLALAGVELLEGRKVYHLSVRWASGGREEVWVDAKSFLDVQVARLTFGPNGTPRMVPTRYRDFTMIEGLQIPMTIQIGDGSTGTPDLMQIEHVVLNTPLNDRRFSLPGDRRPPTAGASGAQSGPAAPGVPPTQPAATGPDAESVPR